MLEKRGLGKGENWKRGLGKRGLGKGERT